MATYRLPSLSGKQALHPRPLFSAMRGLADTSFWGLANSISCPVGQQPGSAWFLLSRADGSSLAKNSFQTIAWNDGGTTTTWRQYVIHRATLLGFDGDSQAPYLIELRDKRQVLRMAAIDREYNVRRTSRQGDSAATDLYYDDSRNSGSDWTWQTMFGDVWGNLPSGIRGTAPTLAYTPANEPENFRFHGSAWDAVGAIMEATQSVLCLNPIDDSFTVQRLGATQSSLSAQQGLLNANRRRVSTDTPLDDFNLSVAPEKIRFYFPKRLELESSLFDLASTGHLVDPYHTIEKTTSLSGAQSGTILPFRTKYIAEIDADGSTVNNSSTLDTLAGEIRDKIVDRINKGTERGRDIYTGIVTSIRPGCEIHNMIWRDYGDDDGCVTELIRNPLMGMPAEADQFQLLPFTGEILVKNTSGGDYSPGSHSFAIMKDNTNTSGQTITATNFYTFKDGKRGTAAVINGQVIASPQET